MLDAYEPVRVAVELQHVLTQFFGVLQDLQELHRQVGFSSVVILLQSYLLTAPTC